VRDDLQTDWRAALAGTGVAVAVIGLVVALGVALGTYRDRPLWGVVLSSIAVAFVASAAGGMGAERVSARRGEAAASASWLVVLAVAALLSAILVVQMGRPFTVLDFASASWWTFAYLLVGLIGVSVGERIPSATPSGRRR
jgi:hypothetical protein